MTTPFVTAQALTADQLNRHVEKLKGGVLRSATAAGATSGTTELAVETTGVISLRATSTYRVKAKYYWTNTVNGDVFFHRIRATNISGTILNGIVGPTGLGGGPYPTEVTYTFETTTATTAVYLACIVRGSGTGTATCQTQSHITVERLGDSGILSLL
jgi:hypothetical protein